MARHPRKSRRGLTAVVLPLGPSVLGSLAAIAAGQLVGQLCRTTPFGNVLQTRGPFRPAGSPAAGSRRARRAITSVLAVLYLVLFSALALGFYASATMSAQISRNERQIAEARIAAESGMRFVRYQLAAIRIPAGTKPEEMFESVYKELSARLDDTRNLGGGAILHDGNSISVPAGGRQIELDASGAGFRAVISPDGQRLKVKVIGTSSARASACGVTMDFAVAQNASKIFDFALASRSPIHLNSNARIRGATNDAAGSVLSTTTQLPALTLEGNAKVSGDVSFAGTGAGSLSMSSNATVAGFRQSDPEFNEHVHVGTGAPEFPTIDTSAFEAFATNVLSVADKKYDTGTLKNIRISAGTNPTFDSNMTVEGVIYVETPNRVTFNSNVEVRGVIVAQNSPTGDTSTNTIHFNSNVKLYAVDTLPATSDFPPELRALRGAMILAPKFAVTFNSNFGAVGGSIIADTLRFDSNAAGSITGSLVNLSDASVHMSSNADVSILSQGTTEYPAGVFFGSHYAPLADTYREVVP